MTLSLPVPTGCTPPAPRSARLFLVAVLLGVLAACSSTPTRDGPEAKPPSGLDKVPNAQPRVEAIRVGGPNKPYEVMGVSYTPIASDKPLSQKGLASWYGRKFHGRRTASGEVYNMYAMTAAHKTMPLPSYARVRNPANGREIIVRVNDRGPFHKGRIIDLSYTAALKLGVLKGVAAVEVERITHEEIRSGAWQRDGQPDTPADPIGPALAAVAAVEEPTAPPPSEVALTPAAQGFWVQLGAFRERRGAEQFQQRVADDLAWLSPLLAVFSEPQFYRLQAGPYPTRHEAQEAAARVRDALKLVPVVIERR